MIQRANVVQHVDQSKDHEGHVQFGYFVVECSAVRVAGYSSVMHRVDGVAEENFVTMSSRPVAGRLVLVMAEDTRSVDNMKQSVKLC